MSLSSHSVPDDQIAMRVSALRRELQTRQGPARPTHQETKSLRPSDTHALGAAKRLESEKMERALRIRPDYREGEAFQPEVQEQRKIERMEERARRQEESRERWEKRREERDVGRDSYGWRRERREAQYERRGRRDLDDPRDVRERRSYRDRGWDTPVVHQERDNGWSSRRPPSEAPPTPPTPPRARASPPPPGPLPTRPVLSRDEPV